MLKKRKKKKVRREEKETVRETKRETERQKGKGKRCLSSSYQVNISCLTPGSLGEARMGPKTASGEGRFLGALGLALWTLATFDTPLNNRLLPLSQLLSSEPRLPHLLG